MKKVIEHNEAVSLLGYKHSSDIQSDIHDFRNVINASDVINVVRFLNYKGYEISKIAHFNSRITALESELAGYKKALGEVQKLSSNCYYNCDTMENACQKIKSISTNALNPRP